MASSTDIPRLFDLPTVEDYRGDLTFVTNGAGVIPFDIKRVFWTYGVPPDAERGGHAHRTCPEFLIAVAGSLRVNLFDGTKWWSIILDSPRRGLLLPAGFWRTLDCYAPGSVSLALAPEPYDETDYIRDIHEFIAFKKSRR